MTSSMPETEQPISINISRVGDNSDKYNAFKEYLIINNLDLQTEVKDLKNQIGLLKVEINEKEIEEDKSDSRIRYMRGLVNNLNEIKKGYISISKEREHLVNNTNRLWNNIYKVSENYHLKLLMYNIILMLENIILNSITYTKFRHIINITLNILLVYIIGYNYYQYYKTICYDKGSIKNKNDITLAKIKDITTELTKLEESTLALDSWIYEV
jgi:hypothetical protein